MKNSDRRDFIKSAIVVGTAGVTSPGAVSAKERYNKKKPDTLPKGIEYIRKIRKWTSEVIRENSSEISKAAEICAAAIFSGKKVYYEITGHNEPQCILETMPGRPSFVSPLYLGNLNSLDVLSENDVIITNRTSTSKNAKNKGAKVIGILMPFEPQKTQGQGVVYINYSGPYMEDICDVYIWDRAPYTVGIMDFDLMPWKSCSAHGAMDGIILGFILASVADKLIEMGINVETVNK